MYHPQSDTDRLYIPRMEGGQWLLSIADCVETEEQNLSLYLDQSEERLLRLSKSERILPQYGGQVSTTKKQKKSGGSSNGKRNSSMKRREDGLGKAIWKKKQRVWYLQHKNKP